MSITDILFGPRMQVIVAHAAKADKILERTAEPSLSRFATIRSTDGQKLDGRDYFMVRAAGDSMATRGIKKGMRVLARRSISGSIADGTVVIVDGETAESNTGTCFRVYSQTHGRGASSTIHDHEKIIGVVTHIVP